MRQLEEFKNIHEGEDIYIIASGKSVDFIDDSFFDNKNVIGVNQAYKKTYCKYLLRKEAELINDIVDNNPDTVHFISYGACGGANNKNFNIIKENGYDTYDNIVIYSHNRNTCTVPKTLPNGDALITTYSTITTAIHLAAYMGAKNIILIGHDCGTINGECNFEGYHTDETYKIAWKNGREDYVNWLKVIEEQTIQVRTMLNNKYNCNIYSLNPFINFGLEGNIYKK